jgi:hypothetical protein
MSTGPEAVVQLARLLDDPRLREASPGDMHAAIDARFQMLVEGIIAEASASDDVFDRDSALSFVIARVEFLAPILDNRQRRLLLESLSSQVTTW